MKVFGDRKNLQISFEIDIDGESRFCLWLNDIIKWGKFIDGEFVPARWSCVNFLYELGSNWVALFHRQTFPGGMTPQLSADDYRFHLDLVLKKAAGAERRKILKEACAFDEETNLALWFDGIFLEELFVFRQGRMVFVSSGSEVASLGLKEARQLFEDFGNFIAANLDRTEYTAHALDAWVGRADMSIQNIIKISLGAEVPQNIQERIARHPLAQSEENEMEYAVAARMVLAARVSEDELQNVLDSIDRISKGSFLEIDKIHKELKIKDTIPWDDPFVEGYGFAKMLREFFHISDLDRVDIECLLKDVFRIEIHEEEFDVKIDAIAVWGKRYGPGIIVNTRKESRTSTLNGRRTALAHELCHLLCDRKLLLPVAEVLCGQTPRQIEKRANAFAAELLLPRHVAFRRAFGEEYISKSVVALAADYKVSKSIVRWQIYNHPEFNMLPDRKVTYINERVRPYLKTLGFLGYEVER